MLRSMLKKEREKLQFACFRRNYTQFPAGTVERGCPPDPDFIVKDVFQSIGIELTQYMRQADVQGSRLRAEESQREAVIARARQRYSSKGLPSVVVSVFWLDQFPPTKRRQKTLARELAELVAVAVPEAGTRVTLENTGLPGSHFPQELHSIEVARFNSLGRNSWAAPVADYTPRLAPLDISHIIKTKEPKLAGYKQRCTQVWLLIVIEGFRPSSFAEITQAVTHKSYETGFDKVLLLKCFEDQVIELPVIRRQQKN